jgi:urocanate hydratase
LTTTLDFETALYPYELVTYGETGQVCQNWLQYRLIKRYLEIMTQEQTLVVESGHPLGLFPSKPDAPRVIITNALMWACLTTSGLGDRHCHGGGQLRADDRGRMDVHRSARDRARYL